MRQAFIVAATSIALVASVGAFARPAQSAEQSIDTSPVLLAQNTNSRMFSLLQDVQRLREQVRRMRGQVQTLEHQIKRNRESQQRMYQELDERLTALENGGTAKGGNKASKAEIKESYLAAFDLLRNGKYNAAIGSFEQFNQKYPDNSYSDNALYWLGQARYVQGDLSGAMKALQKLEKKYPESSKLPSALFRIGVIKETVGKTSDAQAIFKSVIKDYPDSESAAMARKRLQKMGQ